MRLKGVFTPALMTITATGFGSTIAQILILRELLVLFYGNEISTGLIFACWLLWTALGSGLGGWWSSQRSRSLSVPVLLLIVLGGLLPLLICFIRAARILFSISPGELPTLGKMIWITVTVTGVCCPITGALFGLCWGWHTQLKKINTANDPLAIYCGEALGAATGGLAFYFLLFPYFNTLYIAIIASIVILAISGLILQPWRFFAHYPKVSIIWFCVFLLVILCFRYVNPIERKTRFFQWDQVPIAVRDTPYHHISILKKDRQVSVFTNGLWLFSEPDKLSAELAVHAALLQHPSPRDILLIGGGIAGHIEEILKHPGVQRIDYLEPDPMLIPFVEPYLSSSTRTYLKHDRVFRHHGDAVIYLAENRHLYDVILLNMGEPINAEMNRFYTVEFFSKIRRQLKPGGIFSFAVPGAKEMLGETQIRLISTLRQTLFMIFNHVLIFPGDQMRYFATDQNKGLTTDVSVLTHRIAERGLHLTYLRTDRLMDMLNPFGLDYLKAILSEAKERKVNRDYTPTCYFHTLRSWAFQWHPRLERVFSILATIDPIFLWYGFILMGIVGLLFFKTGPLRFNTSVSFSIMTTGAAQIALQLVLLLTFQVLEGFVYLYLALIISLFMAGMGIGSATISWLKKTGKLSLSPVRFFIFVQAVFGFLPLFFMFLFSVIHMGIYPILSPLTMGWIFSIMSVATGFAGGIHFSLATVVLVSNGVSPSKIGGMAYGLDLAGASLGVLAVSFFVLPVYGIMNTLAFLSAISFVSLFFLFRHP